MTRRILAVLLVLCAIAQAAPDKKAPPPWLVAKNNKKQLEIEKHEMLAEYYLLRANDPAGATKEYQAILQLDPENLRASLALATVYLKGKKTKQAVDVLAKLTKKNPKNAEAWVALAELQAETGDEAGMKGSIDKAIAADPANITAYMLKFERSYRKAKAGDATAKAEALDSAQKIRMLSRGNGYVAKMVERAIVELSGDPIELAVFDAKQYYSAAFDSGAIGTINEKMAKARSGFEECTKAQPKNQDCHYYLGLVYSSVKASDAYDSKKAQAEFALAPDRPLAFVESAKLFRASDDNAGARAALEKALAIDGNLAVAHVELGIIDKLAGKTDAAVAHFVAAIDDDPWGSVGDRALGELTKVKPNHPYVAEGVLEGKRGGDIFSSDKYQAVIGLIEQQLGGVDANAPEKAVVETIVQRLADGSGVRQQFRVNIVKTKEPNAMALADGRVYVTRGLFDMMKKSFPKVPIDANNDMLGHVLAHELQHVLRHHTMNSAVFQDAIKEARPLDPAVVTSMTRIQEIDADRQGMVMAFLAGYHPRGGIEMMEEMGKDEEIPKHLDHPTFQERVDYLTEYWTNDVRYAFVSFKLGVAAMDKGAKLETTDMKAAIAAYEDAVENFKRYRGMLPYLKEAMNDLGIAYAKLGVLAMAQDTPLGKWQSRFSLERESAVKYAGLARGEAPGGTRGAGDKARLPWQIRESISQFKEALAVDEGYSKARLNLATVYLAANQVDNAKDALAKVEAKGGVTAGEIELVRGIALAEAKDYDKAKASFDQAINSQVVKRAAAYNLARTLELAGKKEDAKRAYQQYVKLYPGGAWANAATAAAAKL
jgi:predicted Zn-dependent protease